MARVTNSAKVAEKTEKERKKLKTWKAKLDIFLRTLRDWRLLPIMIAVVHFELKEFFVKTTSLESNLKVFELSAKLMY